MKLEVHDYYHNGARLAHEAHSRKKHSSAAAIDAVQLRYALQSTPYAPDIGLAFNALAPPTERLPARLCAGRQQKLPRSRFVNESGF
jgi:hypothetical protein